MRAPQHAESPLHALPGLRITVGQADADLVGHDHRVLQAAVDYVAALGGGVVEVGPGVYTMGDSLHLRRRVTVRGAGERTVLKKAPEHRSPLAADGDFGEEAIALVDPTGFEIGQGVYIASNRGRGFHAVCATLLNRDGARFTLSRPLTADLMADDDAFAATVFPVVSGADLEDATVEDLTIDGSREANPTRADGCRTAGIFLYRGDGCTIRRCTVRGYNGDGISFQQSNDVRVEACVVEGCGGLGLHPGSGSQRPVVRACRATGNDGDGLYFCWRVRHGIAEENVLEDNGGWGISIGHKDSDNTVRGNTVARNRAGGVLWRDEAPAMAAHRTRFEDNTVLDNDGCGLFVRGATDHTLLRGNTIADTGAGRQAIGVRIGPRVGEVVLDGNTVHAETELRDERA